MKAAAAAALAMLALSDKRTRLKAVRVTGRYKCIHAT